MTGTTSEPPGAATDRYLAAETVIAALFASLLDDEPWAEFLDALAAAAAASWATLILTPRNGTRPGLILTPGADPGIGQDYTTRLFADDPFTGLPEGRVSHFSDVVSAQALDRNAAFHAFMAETSSLEVIGVDLREPGGLELRLRLTRAADQPSFDPADLRRLQALVPHLRIALRLFDHLAATETERRIYAGAIAQMAVGVVILDRTGKVIRLNGRASAILADGDGIALRDGAIVLTAADLARQFRKRIARPDEAAPLTLRVPRPSGRGDLLLVVSGADAPDYVSAAGGPATVLFLTDPTRPSAVSPEALRDLFGLTPSEAAIAADVAGGLPLAEVATQHGISGNTVRAHLRSIFTKTGVRRQSQLVHLVHQSLPELTVPPQD